VNEQAVEQAAQAARKAEMRSKINVAGLACF
jgi:hypothetical protein